MPTANPKNVALEPAAQAFVEATANLPFLDQLAPDDGRSAVDRVQDEPIWKPEVDEAWITVESGPTASSHRVGVAEPATAGPVTSATTDRGGVLPW